MSETDAIRALEANPRATIAPCPHCGLVIIVTGAGRHPCSFCGRPLPRLQERCAYFYRGAQCDAARVAGSSRCAIHDGGRRHERS